MTTIPEPDARAAPWWHVPAVSKPPEDAGLPGGSLTADAALFAFAAVLGGITQGYLWHIHGEVLDAIDLAVGVVACLALWWRRSHPVAVFVVAFGAAVFSPMAQFAALVVICTMASRLRGRALIAFAVLVAAASAVFPVVNPAAGEIVKVGFPAFLVTVIAFGWGLYLRARRELVASLRERAERLEADQQHAAEQAREAERRRIAREMHDVLAHRLSLLSVHAGALEFRPDAPAAEITQAAAVIRTSAAAALADLRQVITVLREDFAATDGPPQPGFGQLADLLQESRSAGMTLDACIDLPDAGQPPEAVGRTVYRVIQEGLTNARKHAPGAPVQVRVTADDQAVTAAVISRRLPVLAAPGAATPPGRGRGRADRPGRAGHAGRRPAGTRPQRNRGFRAARDHPEAAMTGPVRVLLVDDDPLVLSGLKMMLGGAADIEVVGEAHDGRGVLPAADLHHPDVVLMDIRMPRLDGIAATRLLRTQPSPPQVIVLTTFDADELVLRALQAGAAGFLLKDTAPAGIVAAIQAVHAGDGSLSPAIARRLITLVAGNPDTAARQQQARRRLASLTPREQQVAAAIAQGHSNADIAAQLHMSLATVKAHVSRLLAKLGAENRVQVALLVHDAATSGPHHPR